jgi:hypothetical protein
MLTQLKLHLIRLCAKRPERPRTTHNESAPWPARNALRLSFLLPLPSSFAKPVKVQ